MQDLIITEKTVDIARIIALKNKQLYRLLPKFILNWAKKLLHEDEINRHLFENKDKIGIDFVEAILNSMGYTVESIGSENIPSSGRFLFSANHPLGGLDGMALMQEIGQKRKDILFPVNDVLLRLPNLKPLFVPIDKYGKNNDTRSLLDEAFLSDNALLYFPAGLCSRRKKGKICDLGWKKTFITKLRQSKRDLVPVYIAGKNSIFFYRFANWRKRLGIRINLEQFFLINEMFSQKNKKIEIIFGKSIPYTTFDDRFNDAQWAKKVKEFVYSLAENPSQTFKVS